MKISIWQVLLFVSLIIGVSWVVFPGPRDLVVIYAQDYKRDLAVGMLERLLAKNPDDPDLNLSMANLAYEGGDVDRAIVALKKVLQLRPERVELLPKLADWLDSVGRPEEAVAVLEEALKKLPAADERRPKTVDDRRDVLLKLLDFYDYLDDIDRASATVKQLLALDRLGLENKTTADRLANLVSAELERIVAARADDQLTRALIVDVYTARRQLLDDVADGQGGPERERAFVSDVVDYFVRGNMTPEAMHLAQAYDQQVKASVARMAVARTLAGYGADKEAAKIMAQLYAENPKDLEVLSALAEQAVNANEFQDAIKHLQRLAELSPGDAGPKRRLGDAYAAAGQFEEAFATLKALPVDGSPAAVSLLAAAEGTKRPQAVGEAATLVRDAVKNDAAVGIRLADAWLAVDRPGEAWPLLRVYALNSGDPALLRKAIEAAAMSSNPATVREVLGLIERQDRLDPALLLDVANILADGNELAAAARMFERYLARVPGDRKTALRLAEIHSWRDAPDLAYAVVVKLLADKPGDKALLKLAAEYAEAAGKDQEAFRAYKTIFALNPGDKRAREDYLRLAEWSGNTAESSKLLAEDSDRDPRNVQKARQAATAFLDADEAKKAVPYLERALALAPGDIELRRSLADTYSSLGNEDRQAAVLEPLAALGVLTPDEAVLVANRLLTRKQPKRALALLQRYEAMKPMPWDAGALLVQTYTLLKQEDRTTETMRRLRDDYQNDPARLTSIADMAVLYKKLDFALDCFNDALRVDPRFAAALKGKAQIYAWNNDSGRAIRGFETYVNRKPTDMDARYQLGELYFTSDRQDDAYGEYKKTLKLIRETREARKAAKSQQGRPTP